MKNSRSSILIFFIIFTIWCPSFIEGTLFSQSRIRDYGIIIGVMKPGKLNAITDVKGVTVGHYTLIQDKNIRTGVTVICPHSGNIFQEKVKAAIHVGNGFGKLIGSTQIEELGLLETPIALTNTLNVFKVADALIEYTLSQRGNENVQSINPVVGETNDGYLNDIQKRPVSKEHVFAAIAAADSGSVIEGSVGAGTGTICFGFKGGIGSSSRVLPKAKGNYTVGVLVQTNFGGILEINGAPIGKELGNYYLRDELSQDGSCMIVVATDAPLSDRNLKRLAKRAILGLAKTGGICANSSGDYVIAFSTHLSCRVLNDEETGERLSYELTNSQMSPLFLAVVEATQEAIYNSLVAAKEITGYQNHQVKAIPMKEVIKIGKKYSIIH